MSFFGGLADALGLDPRGEAGFSDQVQSQPAPNMGGFSMGAPVVSGVPASPGVSIGGMDRPSPQVISGPPVSRPTIGTPPSVTPNTRGSSTLDYDYYFPTMTANVTGLDPSFNLRFSDMVREAPPSVVAGMNPMSGYRSPEHQARLWEGALQKYGTPEAARQWVAPPGRSQHGFGRAMDITFNDPASQEWTHENAPQYGMGFPMSWEPWHLEPVEARGGEWAGYSDPPATIATAMTAPTSAQRPMSRETSVESMLADPTWSPAIAALSAKGVPPEQAAREYIMAGGDTDAVFDKFNVPGFMRGVASKVLPGDRWQAGLRPEAQGPHETMVATAQPPAATAQPVVSASNQEPQGFIAQKLAMLSDLLGIDVAGGGLASTIAGLGSGGPPPPVIESGGDTREARRKRKLAETVLGAPQRPDWLFELHPEFFT